MCYLMPTEALKLRFKCVDRSEKAHQYVRASLCAQWTCDDPEIRAPLVYFYAPMISTMQ